MIRTITKIRPIKEVHSRSNQMTNGLPFFCPVMINQPFQSGQVVVSCKKGSSLRGRMPRVLHDKVTDDTICGGDASANQNLRAMSTPDNPNSVKYNIY